MAERRQKHQAGKASVGKLKSARSGAAASRRGRRSAEKHCGFVINFSGGCDPADGMPTSKVKEKLSGKNRLCRTRNSCGKTDW